MSDRIQRELILPATPDEVWEAVTGDGWLADEVELTLEPGGDARFSCGESVKTGWVEDAHAPERLAFWWAADGGLLDRKRSGREVRYRVTPEPLSDAVSWMAAVGAQWDNRLAALTKQLQAPRP